MFIYQTICFPPIRYNFLVLLLHKINSLNNFNMLNFFTICCIVEYWYSYWIELFIENVSAIHAINRLCIKAFGISISIQILFTVWSPHFYGAFSSPSCDNAKLMPLNYRDIAARNCLIEPNSLRVRLADAALARDIFPQDYHCLGDNENRPIRWMALESLQHNQYNTATDVVSHDSA